MSSMTLMMALAVVGGVVLAVLAAQGAWALRKAGPKRAMLARGSQQVEPVMTSAAPAATAAAHDPLSTRAPTHRASVKLDPLIDAIATLRLDSLVSAEFALHHLPPTRRAGSKAYLVEGLNADSGEWETPVAGAQYSEFQAGVQLASRNGALNEIEYSEFVQKVQDFADGVGALAEIPDMLEVVARGRELDTFAGGHDAQLAVHLRARSATWSIAYIHQHAARHGFVPGAVPGRLVLPSPEEGAPPLLTLSFDARAALADDPNQSAVSDVTLSFDVAQTASARQPFVAWQASAQALSLGMEAAVVDDNGRPLTDAGFAVIGSELVQLYAALEARDLAAGSAAARRLFN